MWIQNPGIRSCAILQRFRCFFVCFLVANFFFFHFWKYTGFVYFFKSEQTKLGHFKNWNYHPNIWTILLLVMWRFSNYAKLHCSLIDRKCRKLWQPAPSLWKKNHATSKKKKEQKWRRKKSCNLFKFELVLLSASVKRVGVFLMRDISLSFLYFLYFCHMSW